MSPGAAVGCTLVDAAAEAYLQRAMALVREARLGAQFPPGRAVLANLEALGARCHRGLYPQLVVEPQSGLPALREWTRVTTDVQVAAKVLAGLPPQEQLRERAPRDPAYGKQLLKWLYYAELAQKPPPPIEQLAVALQRHTRDGVQVQLTLDKIDARGLLLRCTVELCQGPASRPLVVHSHSGDSVAAAPELKALLYRRAGHDAELLFIELAAQPGVTVRRVGIGTAGPLHLPELPPQEGLGALRGGPGSLIGTFATDTAACDLGEDRDNDPLSDLLSHRLSSAARAEYEQARKRLGYHVAKDRKFVADADSLPAISELCRRAGTRNVIYSLRAAAASPSAAPGREPCRLP